MASRTGGIVKWLAYCAPGRKLESALALMFKGEQVSDIEESPHLTGTTDVILVNPEVLELPHWEPDPDAFRINP